MTFIPNANKPTEADEINQHISKLYQCKKTGVWDMEGVMRWLKDSLPQMADAADCMAGYIDDQFPGVEYENEVVAAEGQRELVWSLKQSIDRRETA
jgi:hypothetical protein